jgi:acetyltransferase-like isoleucine patch superfamily enzyme
MGVEQKRMMDGSQGAVSKYKTLTVGNGSWLFFVWYELLILFLSGLGGALGLGLRGFFYRSLFKKVGRGVAFGRFMTLRHPQKIEIGDQTIFDDNTVLDAKGDGPGGIRIGSRVMLGRNSIISCKGGGIELADDVNIGPNCYFISEEHLEIGRYTHIAGHSYLVAGGNHSFDDPEMPICHQPSISKGGIRIMEDVWIGASATVVDGVTIGRGAVIGAGSLVHRRIPPLSVALGYPVEIIKKRGQGVGPKEPVTADS